MAQSQLTWPRFILGAAIKHHRQSQGLAGSSDELPALRRHYAEQVEPVSRKFENQRVATLKSFRKRLYLSLMITLVVCAVLLLFAPYIMAQPTVEVLWPCGLVMLGLFWWSASPIRRYQSDIKVQVFPRIFRYFGDDFIFSDNHRLSLSTFKQAKILPRYDRAKHEDYVQGTYRGVEIVLNEIALVRRVKRHNRTVDQPVFKGLAIELSCKKPFHGHTVLIKNRGGVMNFFSDRYEGLQRVKLEDAKFEKRFDVFSTDQVEARYLLTLAFMERLQALAALFGESFQCAFYQQKLFILLDSKINRFELGSVLKGASFEHEFSQINHEMKQLFAIIDVLKLDEYTGL
ncbi:DUF3137 domain-containing protein [Shewanella gelidii]|uniref:Galanin n=1 Tax=Shewanella gelidii TaxID=1642821 RepID=A0A917JQP5_9GAMM|nr:DUF3137 domain-containing protein [Shewanella gelidii]MCL1099126.1 DUF3137 domain-containing protein [Shewanella gelidii]GGI81525.1 Galanin [Shewanella gelidii]